MTRNRHHIALTAEQSRLLDSVAKAEAAARRAIVVACRAGISSHQIYLRCGRAHAKIFEIAKAVGVRISESVRSAGGFRSGGEVNHKAAAGDCAADSLRHEPAEGGKGCRLLGVAGESSVEARIGAVGDQDRFLICWVCQAVYLAMAGGER